MILCIAKKCQIQLKWTSKKRACETAKAKMLSGKYDLIILDEILVSIHFELFNDEEVMTFMKMKPDNVELILTGRYCRTNFEAADLVTEMKVIKHYY